LPEAFPIRLATNHSETTLPLNSTRLCGTSPIFLGAIPDTFESLAERRVRVVANGLRYLEELPIIFLQQAGRLYIRQSVNIRVAFPKQLLNLNAKAERDILLPRPAFPRSTDSQLSRALL